MKYNISKLLLIIALIVVSSGYKFPEMIPAWENINDFRMINMHFGNSTVVDFQLLAPDLSKTIEGSYTIFTELDPDNEYKSIRVGFKDNFLDWIEFELRNKVKTESIVSIYGKPLNINTKYSKLYDYYDYGFLNFTADKTHKFVTAFNIFDIPKKTNVQQKFIGNLPQYNEFNFIQDIIPGQTLEEDFLSKYPGFVPEKTGKAEIHSVYNISEKQLSTNKNYSGVSIIFKNNILNFIGLNPKNLYMKEVLKNYGAYKSKVSTNNGCAFIEYPNFILVVEEKTQKVLNVGIVSSF